MLTQSTRVFLPLSAVALVAAVVYFSLTGDLAGNFLFLGVMAVAAFAAIAVTGARENEVAPTVPAGAEPPVMQPVPAPPVMGGGGWPVVAAAAVTLLMLGLIVGPVLFMAGLVLAAATAVGWLARVTGDHLRREVNLLPLGLPVLCLFAIASLMFFMSRILLAVSEQTSTFIALVVAVVIMAAGSVVALRPAMSSRAVVVALTVGGILMVAGGLVAAAVGEREIAHEHKAGGPVDVKAINSTFDKKEIHFGPGHEAVINFSNNDAGVPHNVSIYPDETSNDAVFQAELITGKDKIVYRFEAPAPGTYSFRCDVHPNMTGKVVVG